MSEQDPQNSPENFSGEETIVDRSPSSPVSHGQPMTQTRKSLFREYIEAIIIAVVLALLIRGFVAQAFKIPSGSMIPTLLVGDHILVSKMAYGFQWPTDCKIQVGLLPLTCYASATVMELGAPERGDIIVFRWPENEDKDFIKRVIGIPGDTVRIHNKVVFINGQPVEDKAYTQRTDPAVVDGRIQPRDNFGPVTIPPESFFVMGDNRDQSLDSRFWGFVKLNKIKGKAVLIYWSWNERGDRTEWVRWKRLGKLIE